MQFYWCDGQTIFNLFFSLFFSLIIGLPEVLETSSIQAGCLWQYPCLAQNGPCIDGAVCFQKDYSGFKCECDQPKNSDKNSCVKEGFQEGVFGTNIPRGGRPVAVSFSVWIWRHFWNAPHNHDNGTYFRKTTATKLILFRKL